MVILHTKKEKFQILPTSDIPFLTYDTTLSADLCKNAHTKKKKKKTKRTYLGTYWAKSIKIGIYGKLSLQTISSLIIFNVRAIQRVITFT